ncbi:MAG: hypothetical protein MI674_02210 [Cytophagales bacterium]|nr:hypothetical protein [Cytophagales bacterium]
MNRIMNKSFLAKGLLLIALFPVPFARAASSEKNSFVSNTKVGIDFGFGLPYLWAISEETRRKLEVSENNTFTDIKANSNISLGVVLGYSFRLHNNIFKLGPEIGAKYGFTRRLKVSTYNIAIEEKYVQIPIAIKFCRFNEEGSYLAKGFTLGYEFNVLLSSAYKQEGGYDQLKPSFQGNKDLKQAIPDLPRLSGSIFFGGTIDLPKGFYLAAKFRVPIEIFMIKKESSIDELDKDFMHRVRALNTSLVEFNLGMDVMKWFSK